MGYQNSILFLPILKCSTPINGNIFSLNLSSSIELFDLSIPLRVPIGDIKYPICPYAIPLSKLNISLLSWSTLLTSRSIYLGIGSEVGVIESLYFQLLGPFGTFFKTLSRQQPFLVLPLIFPKLGLEGVSNHCGVGPINLEKVLIIIIVLPRISYYQVLPKFNF